MLLAVRISSDGCTCEVWRAFKKLELLLCSPNFPRASITRYTHAKHEPIFKFVSFLNGDPILYRSLFPAPNVFQIPHSLSLDENNGRLFVADRENSRVLVFETHQGKLLREIKDFGERVFAVHYHPEQGNHDTFWVLLTGSFQMKLQFAKHEIRK